MKTLIKSYDSKITSNMENIRNLVDCIVKFIYESCENVSDDVIFDIKVILNELFQNAIKHGNKEDCSKYVRTKAGIVNNSVIYFVIEDEGEGYNCKCVSDSCCGLVNEADIIDLKENGRGILIVKNLCDTIRFNKKGNKVIVLKKLVK